MDRIVGVLHQNLGGCLFFFWHFGYSVLKNIKIMPVFNNALGEFRNLNKI